jgi:hypothetical protein
VVERSVAEVIDLQVEVGGDVLDHVLQLPALLVGECLARGLLLHHPRLEGQRADRISTPVSVAPRFKVRAVGSEGVITNRGRPVARLTPNVSTQQMTAWTPANNLATIRPQ